jgi:hypothetical protein
LKHFFVLNNGTTSMTASGTDCSIIPQDTDGLARASYGAAACASGGGVVNIFLSERVYQ